MCIFRRPKNLCRPPKNQENHIFTYIVPNAPHGPMYAPDKYSQRVSERFKGSEYAKLENGGLNNYYGMIENIDDNFGRLVDFLVREGLEENTLLVFSSDNGAVTGGGKKDF